jgi:hypothetical protein
LLLVGFTLWRKNIVKNLIKKIPRFFAIFIMPLQISMPPTDSTETNLRIIGGYGQYAEVARGCEGNVIDKDEIPFTEIGASLDHKTQRPIRLGIHADYIWTKEERELEGYNQYERFAGPWHSKNIFSVNPFITAEWNYFAIGGGYVWSSKQIIDENHFASGYIRIGNMSSVYFDASLFHTPSIYTEGVVKLGLGSNSNPDFNWWFGLGGIKPHDKAGIIWKSNIRLQKNLFLNPLVRLGISEGISESAIGFGLTYRLTN